MRLSCSSGNLVVGQGHLQELPANSGRREMVTLPRCVILALAMYVSGCATTPRPVPCVCPPVSQRLLEHRDFTTCMTGPWPFQSRWLADDYWELPVRTGPLCELGVLVLPLACWPFDDNRDGDIDLEDYQNTQNAVK